VQDNDMSLNWRKSEFCGSSACVEVAAGNGAYFVRDSKNPDGPLLAFDNAEWSAFLAGVRAGNFDFS
jgi:Domain of unknown function (DUF397)